MNSRIKLLKEEKYTILVTLYDRGMDYWHVVQVDKWKQPLVEGLSPDSYIDVSEFGQVVDSGWGQPPAEYV